MRKFIFLSLTILFICVATSAQERFTQYMKIEAFEVRSGILMMPRYTAANEVCELGFERMLYSPTMIRVDSNLSSQETFHILDELVPEIERGKQTKNGGEEITFTGQSSIRKIEYEKVTIRIYGAILPAKLKKEIRINEVVATVTWKHRQCN